jgi:acyl-CoA reductase-like NAD-dependent aldehyde dehydrogenase
MERARVLNRFADIFEARMDEFVLMESTNNGRPVLETRAQLGMVQDFYRYNAALAATVRSEAIPVGNDYVQYLQSVPIGVCAVLAPYNHPLSIGSRGIAPALAAGNTVVIKPSEPFQQNTVAEFTDRVREIVSKIKVGDPLDANTTMGPLISAAARHRTIGYVQGAVAQGARVLAGGNVPELDAGNVRGFFYEPTVIGDVTDSMTIAQEEVFGPVMTIETSFRNFLDQKSIIIRIADDAPGWFTGDDRQRLN